MLYFEWTSKPNTRAGNMLPADYMQDMVDSYSPGYRSVYLFDEVAAKTILAQGSSKGFNRFDVYSDTLFIDIDTYSISLLDFYLHELRSLGLAHKVFDSGGKGYHIEIPLAEMYCGKDVPYSQRKWVEQFGLKFDASLYRPNSLIALENRLHPVTGLRKRMVRKEAGSKLVLPIVEASEVISPDGLGQSLGSLKLGIAQINSLLHCPPEEGMRHPSLWKCAKSLSESGLMYETVLDLLSRVNQSWDNPKDEKAVTEAVKGAYK